MGTSANEGTVLIDGREVSLEAIPNPVLKDVAKGRLLAAQPRERGSDYSDYQVQHTDQNAVRER